LSSSKFAEAFVSQNSVESWPISKQSGKTLNSLLIADLHKNIRQAIVGLFLAEFQSYREVLKGSGTLWHWHRTFLAGGWWDTQQGQGEWLSPRKVLQCGGGEGKGTALRLTCQYASGLQLLIISEMGQLIQIPWVLWFCHFDLYLFCKDLFIFSRETWRKLLVQWDHVCSLQLAMVKVLMPQKLADTTEFYLFPFCLLSSPPSLLAFLPSFLLLIPHPPQLLLNTK